MALEAEDKELREKLAAEGLALIEVVAVAPPLERSEWKVGDELCCVAEDDDGCASLTIGKMYKLAGYGQSIIDDDGDDMMGCVQRHCFVWVSRP